MSIFFKHNDEDCLTEAIGTRDRALDRVVNYLIKQWVETGIYIEVVSISQKDYDELRDNCVSARYRDLSTELKLYGPAGIVKIIPHKNIDLLNIMDYYE